MGLAAISFCMLQLTSNQVINHPLHAKYELAFIIATYYGRQAQNSHAILIVGVKQMLLKRTGQPARRAGHGARSAKSISLVIFFSTWFLTSCDRPKTVSSFLYA